MRNEQRNKSKDMKLHLLPESQNTRKMSLYQILKNGFPCVVTKISPHLYVKPKHYIHKQVLFGQGAYKLTAVDYKTLQPQKYPLVFPSVCYVPGRCS